MSGRTPRPRILAAIALCLGLLAVTFGVVTPPTAGAAIGTSFVQRCGVRFCLDGKTYYFAGANTYDVFTLGGSYGDTETQYMDKKRIDNHFAQLKADKINVLRLWMFSHEDWHGFEKTTGKYNEQEFALFDYVIESAKKNDVRLIPVFENYWEAYGGIDTRLKWEGLPGGGHAARAAFFNKSKCPGCFASYKNYVSYALNRTNHYSGVKYKDEPAIFAWELMNEPRYQDVSVDENKSGKTLRAWVDEMGAFIKGIDSKHMLGTGLEGHDSEYGFGGDEGNPFVYIHQSKYIDFTSAHPYTTEEWANIDLAGTKKLIRAWIKDSHDVIGKPFFMGEFNFKNVNRSTWWSEVFTDFEAAGGDGSAFWWYLDPGNTASDNYSVKKGASELAAFRTHSEKMAAKSGRTPASGPATSGDATESPTDPSSGDPTSTATTPDTSPAESTPPPSGGCAVTYRSSDWTSGFVADVKITNQAATELNEWSLTWAFPGDQAVTSSWSATVTQSGQRVTAKNLAWNGVVAPGASTSFGFQATYSGGNSAPTEFVLNGAPCAAR